MTFIQEQQREAREEITNRERWGEVPKRWQEWILEANRMTIETATNNTVTALLESGLLEEREIEECEACNNCEAMMTCELVAQNTTHNILVKKVDKFIRGLIEK